MQVLKKRLVVSNTLEVSKSILYAIDLGIKYADS